MKDYKIGTELYSPLCGKCTLSDVYNDRITIRSYSDNQILTFDKYGRYFYNSDCLLFPSNEDRDWSKFKTEPRFDPKTLKPFDKVLAFSDIYGWFCDIFSYPRHNEFILSGGCHYWQVIPYNEETKYLVGTKDEAPEYYRYRED